MVEKSLVGEKKPWLSDRSEGGKRGGVPTSSYGKGGKRGFSLLQGEEQKGRGKNKEKPIPRADHEKNELIIRRGSLKNEGIL